MASRVASSSSTVPFTPKPKRRDVSGRSALSAKEYKELAGTLASVRKVREGDILEEIDTSGDASGSGASRLGERALVNGDHPRQTARNVSRPQSRGEQPTATSSGGAEPVSRPVKDARKLNGDASHPSQVSTLDMPTTSDSGIPSLDGVPREVQEAWICEDMMFVLQGVEGSLIRYHTDFDPMDEGQRLRGVKWTVNSGLDSSLATIVHRLLPVATYYTSIEASMELRNGSEFGMVSHALSSGIRSMLKEYRVLTAQLESLFLSSSTFTLQTLHFHVHPILHTMSLLSSLCLSLESEEAVKEPAEDSDDELGDMAKELGLGGESLKGLMKNLNAKDGPGDPGGPIVGGEILGIVCEKEAIMSGDPTASTLNQQLLLHASQPYCRMLYRWISTGHLSDPFEEFMVKESGHITKGVLESDYTDEYWEGRYTLRDGSSEAESSKLNAKSTPSLSTSVPRPRSGTNRLPGGACIPPFLQPWKHKILLAGKYLNVIRECGIEVKKPGEVDEVSEEMIAMNDAKFYEQIEDAYIYANKTLLKQMLEEQALIPHLRSMKHFFFLDQSDFLTNFLDLAASELRKPAKSASNVKLQSLLDLAVRNPASSSSNDPYKDDLKVAMASQGLYEWLMSIVTKTGLIEGGDIDLGADAEDVRKGEKDRTLLAIDALTLDYSVKFPLSLVISRKTITRYQLIFRFLLHLHHLESSLANMWLEQTSSTWRQDSGSPDMEHWKKRLLSLRARMHAFVRQILSFATDEVLQTQWRSLEGKLARVETVDQLLRDHVDFLDTCLKQCMLTTSKLLSIYARLMHTMGAFVAFQPSFHSALAKFLADPEGESDPAKASQRWTVLSRFERHFNFHTNVHLDAVTYNAGSENVALLALVTRLHQTTLRL